MHPLKRIISRSWLAIFIVLALYFLLTYLADNESVFRRMPEADFAFLLLAAISQIAYFALTMTTWRRILTSTTGLQISRSESLSQILLLNFGKYIPGKVWGLAARGARLKAMGLDIRGVSGATYLEQLLLLSSGVGLALVAAGIGLRNYYFLIAALVVAVLMGTIRSSSGVVERLVARVPRMKELAGVLRVRTEATDLFWIVSGFLLVWLTLSLTFVFVSRSVITLDLNLVNSCKMVLALTTAYLAGFLAVFAPGGVGVREGVGAGILSTMMSLEDALFVMLLFRVWTVVGELTAGGIVVAWHRVNPDNDGD